jgi:hypothetical protein
MDRGAQPITSIAVHSYFAAKQVWQTRYNQQQHFIIRHSAKCLDVGDKGLFHLATVKTAGVHHVFKIEVLDVLVDGEHACWT